MSRYINEDAVIKAVDKHTVDGDGFSYLDDDISCILEELPTADVKPVVRGEWGKSYRRVNGFFYHDCPICRTGSLIGANNNFCGNCGADMRGERNG